MCIYLCMNNYGHLETVLCSFKREEDTVQTQTDSTSYKEEQAYNTSHEVKCLDAVDLTR
jgi:hypothetical protein